jgi:hypothetical protein
LNAKLFNQDKKSKEILFSEIRIVTDIFLFTSEKVLHYLHHCCSPGQYLASSRFRSNSGQIILGTKIAEKRPDSDYFSTKNNLPGI